MVKVPDPDQSQEEQESGSEASDSVSNGGTQGNVTLITLNSEGMEVYFKTFTLFTLQLFSTLTTWGRYCITDCVLVYWQLLFWLSSYPCV